MSVQGKGSMVIAPSVLDYVSGWSARRADLVVGSMAQEGVYVDAPHPVITQANMRAHLESVAWVNFPDMNFDTLNLLGVGISMLGSGA